MGLSAQNSFSRLPKERGVRARFYDVTQYFRISVRISRTQFKVFQNDILKTFNWPSSELHLFPLPFLISFFLLIFSPCCLRKKTFEGVSYKRGRFTFEHCLRPAVKYQVSSESLARKSVRNFRKHFIKWKFTFITSNAPNLAYTSSCLHPLEVHCLLEPIKNKVGNPVRVKFPFHTFFFRFRKESW